MRAPWKPLIYLYIFALPLSLGALEILLPLLAVLTLTHGLWQPRLSPSSPPLSWSLPVGFYPLLLLLLTCFLGVLVNGLSWAHGLDAVGSLRWILYYGLLHNLLVHTQFFNRAEQSFRLLAPVVLLIALYATSQFWTGLDIIRGPDFNFPIAYRPAFNEVRWRSIGFFNSPLTYGYVFTGFCCLFSVMSYRALGDRKLRDQKPLLRILLLLTPFAILASLLTTYARGVWIALLGGLLFAFFKFQKKLLLIGGAVLVVGMSLYIPFDHEMRERIFSIFDPQYTSNLERLKIWQANIEIFKDSPLVGVGYENNDRIIGRYYDQLGITDAPESHAHNTYLQFLAGTGVLGLLGFLGFLLALLRTTWNLALIKKNSHFFYFGVLGLFTSVLIGGLTECNFKDAEVNHLFVFFAALVSAASTKRTPAKRRKRSH